MKKLQRTPETAAVVWGRRAFLFSPALFFAVALATYWPHIDDFFALDDYVWLQAADTGNVPQFLKQAFSFPAGTVLDYPTPFWRPLIDVYFLVAWRLFGLGPEPYHAVNIVLHATNAALLIVLMRQIGASRATGLTAALLFLVLPAYGFAVTWISGVTELLAACFYLISLVAFVAYLRGTQRAALFYAAALLAFLLALLSKESCVTLPAILAGLALALRPPRSVGDLRRRLWELGPFVSLAAAYFVFLYVQEYEAAAEGGLYRFGWHFFENMWGYLRWITFPFPEAEIEWARELQVATALAFIALGVWTLAARKRVRALFFTWVIVALLPYSFFESGIEARYTYAASIPLAGFAVLMLSPVFGEMRDRLGPLPSFTFAAGVLIVGGVFLAGEVRNNQAWIGRQANEYSKLFHETPLLCGRSSPGQIYLIESPLFDYHGSSTRMTLNLLYDDVAVHLLERRDPIPPDVSTDDCVLKYSSGRYVRIRGP
ncbi:MAG: hypothetical protein QME71_10700 [Dehalococcoidia bacterium]|nr:hypothetical protein [Dehalococcoidia bacterium]